MKEGRELLIHHHPESRENQEHRLDVLVEGKNIGVAFFRYYSRPLPFYFIEDVNVDKEWRGRGYGKKIIEFLEKALKEKGKAGFLIDGINPETHSEAAGMYERHGWLSIPNRNNYPIYGYNLPEGMTAKLFGAAIDRAEVPPFRDIAMGI